MRQCVYSELESRTLKFKGCPTLPGGRKPWSEDREPSAPELVARVNVAWVEPLLRHLAVLDVEHLNGVVVQLLPFALARRLGQDDRVLVVGQHCVEVKLE